MVCDRKIWLLECYYCLWAHWNMILSFSRQYICNYFLSFQKTIRHSKVGTLSKKMKAPEISDADKLKAAIEVRKNTIKINIIDLWKRVQVRM